VGGILSPEKACVSRYLASPKRAGAGEERQHLVEHVIGRY
jgi:hypothetical protein